MLGACAFIGLLGAAAAQWPYHQAYVDPYTIAMMHQAAPAQPAYQQPDMQMLHYMMQAALQQSSMPASTQHGLQYPRTGLSTGNVAPSTSSPTAQPRQKRADTKLLGATDQCKDINENCFGWAANDQCRTNPGYMHSACPESCQRCDYGSQWACVNKNTKCENWAQDGECASNPAYMFAACKLSCFLCG
eukprot:TRINITY_DN38046_c0_g1_i1.p1 TRINITY_DN38046_c0_g1~~TRINITY_DN38046_c0_g1_i1.p1  ORF type:complete len:189 (-),score=21.08 TRINITY_DN38046_c0_g1_i1:83-649(-)